MKPISTEKRWALAVISVSAALFILCAAMVITIDPYFLYRAPVDGLSYFFSNESYVNAGIARNFEYDAFITGSSVSSNFLCSDIDEMFGSNSVKMVYRNGKPADYRLLFELLGQEGKKPRFVIWGIDFDSFVRSEPDARRMDNPPDYLYGTSRLIDAEYWFNKTTIAECMYILFRTALGFPAETMDDYTYWGNDFPFSEDWLLSRYTRPPQADQIPRDTYTSRALENFELNLEPAIKSNPETVFYLFAPPSCILYWDYCSRNGDAEAVINAYFAIVRAAAEYENVRFSFLAEDRDIVTNLNYYTDLYHFSPDVNKRILAQIISGEFGVTRGNIDEIRSGFKDFVLNYDYDAIWSKK